MGDDYRNIFKTVNITFWRKSFNLYTKGSRVAIFSYAVLVKKPIHSRTKNKFDARKSIHKLQHNQTLLNIRSLKQLRESHDKKSLKGI